MENKGHVVAFRAPSRFFLHAWFDAFALRFPFPALVVVIIGSNLAGSFFNFFYNTQLIVDRLFDAQQKAVFWGLAAPIYNLVAYPLFLALLFYLFSPMMRCLARLRRGETVEPEYLQYCQRRLVNFPRIQLALNPCAWLPGAIFFPWMICTFGSSNEAGKIWAHFAISFVVSTFLTTVQTYFIVQAYLTTFLYADFFKDARPEAIPGVRPIRFAIRMVMMWGAVTLIPMVAILAVAYSFPSKPEDYLGFYVFASGLVVVSALSSIVVFWLVGRDLWHWIQLHSEATGIVARGDFDVRIDHPRPDEWGVLTNHFNDMATSLNQTWESHETLGQLVSPEVRDQILHRMHGFEVQVQEITVLFVDIRGFTPRCAGQPPEKIGALLNRFLTLALRSIEEKGGYVNKFLGDGVMALFGATHTQDDHADLAVASAREMLQRLRVLNDELFLQGEAPLVIGIGIHTGQALVGCFGAVLQGDDGKPVMRREFSAIGETVNLCQRIEQLTKKCPGPILLTAGTKARLHGDWALECLGPQDLPGAPEPMVVYRARTG